jgi:hypothetical protein
MCISHSAWLTGTCSAVSACKIVAVSLLRPNVNLYLRMWHADDPTIEGRLAIEILVRTLQGLEKRVVLEVEVPHHSLAEPPGPPEPRRRQKASEDEARFVLCRSADAVQ